MMLMLDLPESFKIFEDIKTQDTLKPSNDGGSGFKDNFQ
jgi:hypothetical protein